MVSSSTKVSGKSKQRAGKVVVTVVVRATGAVPTGTVKIYDGSKVVGSVKLTSSHKGVVKVKLGKLKKGKHKIKAVFKPSGALKGSTSKVITLKVT